MDVTTPAGHVYRVSIPIPSGFPGNPLSSERIGGLFREAARYGGRPLSEDNLEKIVALVDHLEDCQDVRDLIPLMTAPLP